MTSALNSVDADFFKEGVRRQMAEQASIAERGYSIVSRRPGESDKAARDRMVSAIQQASPEADRSGSGQTHYLAGDRLRSLLNK